MQAEEAIREGLRRVEEFYVREQHSAPHVGSGTVRVLATPWMIAFMEVTARRLLDEHLPETHTSVGTHVDVRHAAACAVRTKVETRVEVLAREGRRVKLAVEVLAGERQIGVGMHERVVVDKAQFLERVSKEANG